MAKSASRVQKRTGTREGRVKKRGGKRRRGAIISDSLPKQREPMIQLESEMPRGEPANPDRETRPLYERKASPSDETTRNEVHLVSSLFKMSSYYNSVERLLHPSGGEIREHRSVTLRYGLFCL